MNFTFKPTKCTNNQTLKICFPFCLRSVRVEHILIVLRPLDILAILGKITEPVPFKFPKTDGATKFNLPIGYTDNFPIATARTAFDMNLLSD